MPYPIIPSQNSNAAFAVFCGVLNLPFFLNTPSDVLGLRSEAKNIAHPKLLSPNFLTIT